MLIGRLHRTHLLCAADVSSLSLKVSPGCICLKGYFLLVLTLWIIARRVVVLGKLAKLLRDSRRDIARALRPLPRAVIDHTQREHHGDGQDE